MSNKEEGGEMDFSWTKEQEMWRNSVREFAQKEISPRAREIDTSGKIPEEIIKGMAGLGLLALTVSEDYGGAAADWTMAAIAAEELGRADMSLATAVLYLLEASWGFIFNRYGTEEAKREYLPRVTKGEAFLGIATTESGGGSDIVGACRTRAVQEGNEWILNGEKLYISGVAESLRMGGIHLTLARTTPDPAAGHRAFSLFAMPLKDNPGISTTLLEEMGRMGISSGGFAMENAGLPKHHLVGEVNRGFYHVMEGFSAARVLIGATCVGAARAALEMGMDYIKERKAFGRPIASYEGIQFPLAEHYINIESAELLTYKAAWMMDAMYRERKFTHYDVALAAAMPKLRAPTYAFRVMNEVADWLGAMAYTKEYPLEMGIRGIRSYSIGAEGTQNIMRLIIARELLGTEFLPYRR